MKHNPRNFPCNPAFASPARCLMLLLTGLSLLAGCGFQLRGNIDLPPELARVSVVGADRDLVDRLSDALAQRGAAVTDSAPGVATIDLRESRFAREVLTTDTDGRATAYALHYRVVFGVTTGDDTPISAPLQAAESLTLKRVYDYASDRELQAEQEVRFLKTEMRREAVLRMLRRLNRL